MPVEVNQWRAAIGTFRISTQKSFRLSKLVRPFSLLYQIIKLYWLCCCFVAFSVLVLPLAMIVQFVAVHSFERQSSFLPTFSRTYYISRVIIYITIELSKRMPLGFIYFVRLARYRYCTIRKFILAYAYVYMVCMTCYTLYTQWALRRILLSGDIETNPAQIPLIFVVGI